MSEKEKKLKNFNKILTVYIDRAKSDRIIIIIYVIITFLLD